MNKEELRELLKKLPPDEKYRILLQQVQSGKLQGQYLNPFDRFEPTPMGRIFLGQTADTVKLDGGNGSSKTFTSTYLDCCFLLGRVGKSMEGIWKRPIPQRPVRWRVCGVDDRAVDMYIVPTFEKILPPGSIVRRNKEKHLFYIRSQWSKGEADNQLSVLEILTYQMEVSAHAGASIDGVRFDEEPPRPEYYLENSKRLRGSDIGLTIFAMTPENGKTWTFEELDEKASKIYMSVPNKDAKRLPEYAITDEYSRDRHIEVQEIPENAKNDIVVVNTTLYDNQHIDDDYIVTQYNRFDSFPEKREISLLGKTVSLSGLVYPTFNIRHYPVGHIYPDGEFLDNEVLDPDFPRFISIDPHHDTPFAALKVCIMPDEKICVEDEFWMGGGLNEIRHALWQWENKEKVWNGDLRKSWLMWRIIDPFAVMKNLITKTSIQNDLNENPYNMATIIASKDKDRGIPLVRSAFYENRVIVHPRCKKFIDQHKKWVYNEQGKPLDKNDHFCECFYRFFLQPNFKFLIRKEIENAVYDPYLMCKSP